MTKPLKKRGRHVELPILGDTVAELRIASDRIVTRIFRSKSDHETTLEIEDSIVLSRGTSTQTLKGSKPGTTFAPQTLQPLLELIGCTIVDALAQEDGAIRLDISNAMTPTVASTDGYESWHLTSLNSPAPFTLHGGSGCLI